MAVARPRRRARPCRAATLRRRVVVGVAITLLALAQPVGAVVTTDPAGDAEVQGRGAVRDPGATDLRAVEGTLQDGTLRLRIEVEGDLPVEGEVEADRRYTYLFLVARGGGEGKLHGEVTVAATCQFHRGMSDLGCEVTQGNATLRGIGQAGRNVTMRLGVDWSGDFRVGGAAHESVPNGTQRDILVQDFTANALPGQEAPTTDPPGGGGATAWWKTPWILLFVLGALVAAGWAGSQWSARRQQEDAQHRDARRRRKN